MKKTFIIFGVLAVVLVIAVAFILRSSPADGPKPASCSIVGYTNQSGTNLVLLRVTNQSQVPVICFVEPRMIFIKGSDEVRLKDRYPAAIPAVLLPHTVFTFTVPCSMDTNLLYVRFGVEECEFGWSRRRQMMMNVLRRGGLFKPKSCLIKSPPFGKGE